MKLLYGLAGSALGVALLAPAFGLNGSSVSAGLRNQVNQDRQTIQQDQQKIRSQDAAIAQAEARLGGVHQDLITCGDLQNLGISVTGSDAYGNNLQLYGTPNLPSHCINR